MRIVPYSAGHESMAVSFYDVAATEDPTIAAISPRDWSYFVDLPQNLGGRDFRIAMIGDRPVGLLMSSIRDDGEDRLRHVRIVVTSSFRRRGHGTALLKAASNIAPEVRALQSICPDAWTSASAFYTAFGFEEVEQEFEMNASTLAPETGSGNVWIVRKRDRIDRLAGDLAFIHNQAYAGTRSFIRLGAQQIEDLFKDDGEVWTAEKGGEIIGFCHVLVGRSSVWIESVAVRRGERRKGAATALIRNVLKRHKIGDRRSASLSVTGDNGPACTLYRKLGFKVVSSATRYRGELGRVRPKLDQHG